MEQEKGAGEQAEKETESDGPQQQQRDEDEVLTASEKKTDQEQAAQKKSVSETVNNDATETVNLQDSVDDINSDSECPNCNVADGEQQTQEAKNQIDDVQMEQQSHKIEQSQDQQNEIVASPERDDKEPEHNGEGLVEIAGNDSNESRYDYADISAYNSSHSDSNSGQTGNNFWWDYLDLRKRENQLEACLLVKDDKIAKV